MRGVPCEVCLPKRATGAVELRLHSIRPHRLGSPFQFSVTGQIRSNGRVWRTVRASRVFWKPGGRTMHWSPNLAEELLIGDPIDLTITTVLGGFRRLRQAARTHVTFWITPNVHLRPEKFRITSYTGKVTVRRKRCRRFTIGGVPLTFDHYFRYTSGEDGDDISFQEPVAAGWVARLADVPKLLTPLEDILLLAGVAARQRAVCVGWEATDSSVNIRYYRRGRSIPPEKKDHGFNHVLIAPEDFSRFLRRADRVFRTAPEQELLRQAMQRLVYDDSDDRNLGNSFMRLYGAVEALLLWYCRLHAGEFILPPKRFQRVAKAVRGAVRSAAGLTDTKASLVIDKIPELNRVPFSSALRTFCTAYGVNLTDLWPLASDRAGSSLSIIRNRLVHGDTISDDEMSALVLAHEHLRWTAERLILGVFGWPIERSRVHVGVAESIPNQDVMQARQWLAHKWRRQAE